MEIKPELTPPCGLYCGVCEMFIAHRDNNDKFKKLLAEHFNLKVEQIRCRGCGSDEMFHYCRVCPIKSCAAGRGIAGCHECDDFPCAHVEAFPAPVGKKVILRSVPYRKRLGDEKWLAAEIERYHCPHCGCSLYRGAKRCRSCRGPVDQD